MGRKKINDGLTKRQRFYNKYPDRCKKATENWRKRNIDKLKIARILWEEKRKEAWALVIKELGLDTCSVCGYNKNFAAIDFHHGNDIEKSNKKYGDWASDILMCMPTEQRIEQIKTMTVLCANCHRELHHPVEKSI